MNALDILIRGDSIPIRRVRELVMRVAPSNLPVLIQGPTGSGKELVAHALHLASGRRGDFVPFNVCAIAETMFEDALFGHVRGAFTGALTDTRGFLAQADRGTCFFDEVSGLALGNQAKLLRALESRQFRPVGARSDVSSDFRIVAASNEDLQALRDAGKFRDDLLHRFGKVVIRVPALSERAEDIPALARHFLSQSVGSATDLAASAERRLMEYHWPGNVRELKSVIEASSVLSSRATLTLDDVSPFLRANASGSTPTVRSDFVLRRTVTAVMDLQGDVYAAAEQLGVNPTTVYRRLRRAGFNTIPARLEDGIASNGATRPPLGATKRNNETSKDMQATA